MVRVMKSKSINHFIHETQRDSAPKLHKLYDKNSAPFEIPTARDIIIQRLTWDKWFAKEFEDIAPQYDEYAEFQELCKLANVDWNDLDISIIDEFLANKKQRILQGERLTFKDFRLKS